ncbi:hypothetical protein Syun_028664 [Stephania yunnanensis]|uniref:UBC core domain-containing protein n=1 Tax=Stephania yunnanensis TaxID=152371 RepID=A0AAP0E6L6_9MAGN
MYTSKDKLMQFKQFDAVVDYGDHHFAAQNQSGKLPISKTATKKIMQEWKILEESLPETIFVRVYESRIDLLRACIIGPNGTPYQDGLFFFDICFGCDYPSKPPKVHYRSYGMRINPNLYETGLVCLSLLNTWLGNNKSERWDPSKSTILQVLVSIQALVLNEKPYYNEPFIPSALFGRHYKEKKSMSYSEDVFVLCCKTMIFLLSRPPSHFKGFVAQHFKDRAEAVLMNCRACLEVSSNRRKASKRFAAGMDVVYPQLVTAFEKNGSSLGHFIKHLDKKEKEKEKCESKAIMKKKKKSGLMSKLKRLLGVGKV